MNLTSWSLLAIGTLLFFWGVFKQELSFEAKMNIVKERASYLLAIKRDLGRYLKRAEYLSITEASLYDLSTYQQTLKSYNKSWKWLERVIKYQERKSTKDALYSRIMDNFMVNNIPFDLIKQDDSKGKNSIRFLQMEIGDNLSKVNDKKLSRYIGILYNREHIANSYAIFCKLSRDKFSFDLSNDSFFVNKERRVLDALQKAHTRINQRIDLLKRGGDL